MENFYHDFLTVYPDGSQYQISMVTKQHMQWCKDGEMVIMDLVNNKDCIEGVWVQNKN